jgi:hypothetical protein
MSIIINQQKDSLASLKRQLAYTEDAFANNTESWKRKEYEQMVIDYNEEISQLESCIATAEAAIISNQALK